MEAEKAKTLSEGEHTLPLNFAEKSAKMQAASVSRSLWGAHLPCREDCFCFSSKAFAGKVIRFLLNLQNNSISFRSNSLNYGYSRLRSGFNP